MNLSKKIAFVTGANRGIGFETARELAESGVRVIIGSRDKKNGEEAAKKLTDKGYDATSIVFDVTNPTDHQKVLTFIDTQFGKLDILVNNAGVLRDVQNASASSGLSNNTSTVSIEAIRETFDANFFGVVALTQTLLPLIRKSPAGRIVNLSSILGSLALHANPRSPIYNSKAFAYNSSKVALNAFTIHLAHELKDTSIKVNSAHPGWVKTDMGGPDGTLEVSEGAKTSMNLATLPADGPTGGFFHLGEPLPW